jgi:hypothetical protein
MAGGRDQQVRKERVDHDGSSDSSDENSDVSSCFRMSPFLY